MPSSCRLASEALPFSRGKRTRGGTVATVSPMRLPALAVVAVVAAVAGRRRCVGHRQRARLARPGHEDGRRARAAPRRRRPCRRLRPRRCRRLPGNGFDPQRIFAERSPGVVTIFAYFGEPELVRDRGVAGLGLRHLAQGLRPHEFARDHECRRRRRPVQAADHLYVEFADGDRAEAKVVGWDLYDDVGLLRSTRMGTRSRRCRSATRRQSPSASRSRRSGARSGATRGTRSPSGSSRRSIARSTRSPSASTRSSTRSRPMHRSRTETRAGLCSTRAAA